MTKDMVLQTKDVNLLLSWGYQVAEIPQIQDAIYKSEYMQYELEPPYKEIKQLTAEEAYKKLGHRQFLSGISRSAFHWSASREYSKKYGVAIDSSRLFKG